MMFIILLLIVAVAAFNIVSTLVMAPSPTSSPTSPSCARSGAEPRGDHEDLHRAGALIAAIGTLIAWPRHRARVNIDVVVPFPRASPERPVLSREVYYITDLPSDLQKSDVVSIALVALALAFLATLYPSWRAARVNPAEALR